VKRRFQRRAREAIPAGAAGAVVKCSFCLRPAVTDEFEAERFEFMGESRFRCCAMHAHMIAQAVLSEVGMLLKWRHELIEAEARPTVADADLILAANARHVKERDEARALADQLAELLPEIAGLLKEVVEGRDPGVMRLSQVLVQATRTLTAYEARDWKA
jgi:hypothetical protein